MLHKTFEKFLHIFQPVQNGHVNMFATGLEGISALLVVELYELGGATRDFLLFVSRNFFDL